MIDLSIAVSDVLEMNALGKERYVHIDIAGWLIKWLAECIREYGWTECVPIEVADRQAGQNRNRLGRLSQL